MQLCSHFFNFLIKIISYNFLEKGVSAYYHQLSCVVNKTSITTFFLYSCEMQIFICDLSVLIHMHQCLCDVYVKCTNGTLYIRMYILAVVIDHRKSMTLRP